mmetsp:Transcript_298/g.355  ORF Transcript_298/g.355 Transcript_298/m.355 type:complete len:350 (+) Transcript_298:125-1174(+)|eukprot:CAMPEP_0119034404 /NCGR_PEP_ID=MMETSP1177-20130426/1394_1 /TAXON_ID=2985 /ORGANISM="Ochromonas sp, Strain CCMP1899" /LENGTH=349 /DNA_ID=CAMNT_0006991815 /DNA_START=125 /DNA_END=1174 /DNA_ORIENTATION=+
MSSLKRKAESDGNVIRISEDDTSQIVKQNYESNASDLTSTEVSIDMNQETKDLEEETEQGEDNHLDDEISNTSNKIIDEGPALCSSDLSESEIVISEESSIPKEKEVPKKIKDIKHPLSAWMIFSTENRELINKEQPSLTFTEVAKALGEKYRGISIEEKERLEGLAKAEKERYNREIQAAKANDLLSGEDLHSSSSSSGAATTELSLPLGRVRKIVKLDNEVKAVNKEALVAIAKATELFIAYMGIRCTQTATQRGVRTVKDQDLVQTIHSLETMSFLRLDFPKPKLNLGSGKEKKTTTRPTIAQQTNSTGNSAGIRSFFNSTAPSTAIEKKNDVEIPETSKIDELEE